MDKWGAVNTKLTKEDGTTRSTVVVCVLTGVLIAGGLFVAGMYAAEPVIDAYLHDTKQIYWLYDFYDQDIGSTQTAVYFIGSSVVGDAVHCREIDQYLQNAGYNISTYNLLMDGDTPLRRLPQIQNIISSHPSLVVIGVTYRSVTDDQWVDETVVLVHDKLKINPDASQFYSSEELHDLKQKPDLRYKVRFLRSVLMPYRDTWGNDGISYAKDPFIVISNDRRTANILIENIQKQANDPSDKWRPVVPAEMTRHKQALIYNVQTLQDAGIPVVLINMPLHPLFSEKITNESRQNFFDLLNETGAKWYDMEFAYDSEYFRDSHHASLEGGTFFSQDMAELIISEVKSGAVHYA
ncbi:MAG: hypothetical protein O0X93_00255 [Methanocorpusculum sp.]|nr:hypothetical protein [Methanocorpusculum sp.]MDE2523779.1 hypothetical protein [Methanocorpusculum sp.]